MIIQPLCETCKYERICAKRGTHKTIYDHCSDYIKRGDEHELHSNKKRI